MAKRKRLRSLFRFKANTAPGIESPIPRDRLAYISIQKDRERAVYGLKEKNLAKTYIKLIPLGMRDPDAIRLLNWKKPTERDVRTLYAFLVMLSYCSPENVWRFPDRVI